MTNDNNHFDLLIRYLDGVLPEHERDRVEELLQHDEAAREILRTIAEQAVVTADIERAHRARRGLSTEITPDHNSSHARGRRRILAVAAIAFVAVMAGQFLATRSRPDEIINVVALGGPHQWTGDGGQITADLAAGDQLPGGTMELLAPDSWVELQLRDRSTVTLTGLSAVTITEQPIERMSKPQQQLYLRHGRLSAIVEGQAKDLPMLMHTPSAVLTVLGTRFDVDAVSDVTQLSVSEGRVRLKRLNDGSEIDVSARQSVTASMENHNALSLREYQSPVTVWRSDLRADVVSGKWISKLWMVGAELKKAVATGKLSEKAARVAYKKAAVLDDATGSVWALPSQHGSLVVLSLPRSAERPVLLSENAMVRVRGRMHTPASLRIGLSTYRPGGGFAGKSSVRISAEDLAGVGSDFELELPVSRFIDIHHSADSMIGNELVDWWCVADKSSAKVEITSVEITCVELMDNAQMQEKKPEA